MCSTSCILNFMVCYARQLSLFLLSFHLSPHLFYLFSILSFFFSLSVFSCVPFSLFLSLLLCCHHSLFNVFPPTLPFCFSCLFFLKIIPSFSFFYSDSLCIPAFSILLLSSLLSLSTFSSDIHRFVCSLLRSPRSFLCAASAVVIVVFTKIRAGVLSSILCQAYSRLKHIPLNPLPL